MIEEVRPLLKMKGYDVISYLNKGGFGSCFVVHSLKYDVDFVCKVTIDLNLDDKKRTAFTREVNALAHLNHPNVVRVYDHFTVDKYLFLILEYCKAGSLNSMITSNEGLPINTVIMYTKQVLDALCYMHSKGIAHSDIKPANILIDSFARVKLCDFGLSQAACENEKNSMNFCGSTHYMAPEILMNTKYDPMKADVWSFGISLYYFLTGRLPFCGLRTSFLIESMKVGHEKMSNVPKMFNKIVDLCLRFDPQTRPSMFQIKKVFDDNFDCLHPEKINLDNSILRRSAHMSIIKMKRIKLVVEATVC